MPSPSALEDFREHLREAVERMNASLDEPEATWPGVLFLQLPNQDIVIGEMRSLAGISESDKRDLAARVLPARIRSSKADRFGWVMPAWRNGTDPRTECLVLVVGERGRTEALIVDVIRNGRPHLGEWGMPARNVSGLFATPLARALLVKPRTRRRAARKPGDLGRTTPSAATTVTLGDACPSCGCLIDEPHRPRCDVERCSACFGQRLMCDCPSHDPLTSAWTGEWPGKAACRDRGWWAVRVAGEGWRPCPPGTPGAIEDINRLTFYEQCGHDGLYDEE